MASRALLVFVNGFVAIALACGVALFSHTPFVFPSLGPTAFMLYAAPLERAASPRSTLGGHAIGIVCGYAALWLFGLLDAPPALAGGMDAARIGCSALSLAATGALMILLGVVHPPAGATTLIVSLGIIDHPLDLLLIEAAVAVMVVQAMLVHRLSGTPYPLWDAPSSGR